CSAETARSAGARKQVNDMNKHRHLPHLSLLVGFLMMTATAAARQSAAAGQSNTAGSPFNTTFGPFNTTSSPFNTASSPFSATAGQIKTAKPGEPVERQLTGDAPLTGPDEQTYGNHLSLSKARAQRIALAMQEKLGLPGSAIESDGRGDSHPVAANETVQGRALNRRIEVEFWYDDPLQAL